VSNKKIPILYDLLHKVYFVAQLIKSIITAYSSFSNVTIKASLDKANVYEKPASLLLPVTYIFKEF